MPFIYDFSNTPDTVHTVDVSPKGWKSPLVIEYVTCQAHEYDPMVSVAWRIRGTRHTFTIGEQQLNTMCHGKSYKAHFEKALERFRIDYLRWFTEEDYKDVDWKYEYQREYGKLIVPDERNSESKN